MKVLLLVHSFPPEVRSESTLMHQLATDLVQMGHQVSVVTGIPRYTLPEGVKEQYQGKFIMKERQDGVEVLRLPLLPVPRRVPLLRGMEHFALAFEYLLGGLFQKKPDVVLVYSPPLPLGLSAIIIDKLRGAPLIFNVQDIYPQTAIDLGLLRGRAMIRLSEKMERFIYLHAAVITVHSEGNRDVLVGKGVPPEKLRVVPNWVDTRQVHPGERLNGFRQKHALGDKFIVSFAGTMGYAQGLDTVLEAAALLKDHEDILFLMVGDGSFKDVLVGQAQAAGLSNVKFLPMQPEAEYPHVLAASDACLVTLAPEVKTPVVPAKLISIMASGRPVLASVPAQGDVTRIIEAARCGVWAPPGDQQALAEKVLQLYQEPESREEQGRNGRAYAEAHLSRKECVAKYEQLLAEVGRN